MTLSMYQASVPVFLRQLGTMAAFLAKDAEKAEGLVDTRLAEDMFPLKRQVQIATDGAKGAVARLAGIEAPVFADDETTLADLQARIAKTIAFIESVTPAQIDGSEGKEIVLKFPSREFRFTGQAFLLHFALPNFFFHVTTTYALLRHGGVALGKTDYLGE